MEKTFEELIEDAIDKKDYSSPKSNRYYGEEFLFDMMQQVREATIAEIEGKANEYGEYGTADYVHQMPTDRIKLTE